MTSFLHDLRYAVRALGKSRSFTALAVIALALGIGANSAIFSAVNGVVLRPLPFFEPERLIQLWEQRPLQGRDRSVVSPAEFIEWRDRQQVFEQLAALNYTLFNITGTAEPEQVQGAAVSASFFPMLGVAPASGRTFTEAEDQPEQGRVAVISYGLCQRRFGGSSDGVGQQITLDQNSYTVIGVMPSGFQFPPSIEVWVPIAFAAAERDNRGNHFLEVYARLKPHVTIEQAQAQMSEIASEFEQAHLDTNTGHIVAAISLHEQIIGSIRPQLLVLLAAVGFVLLIACANVANLLLVRATGRQKEIAIRVALGASRWRITRQLLTESLLLAFTGGALGLLLGWWGIDGLVTFSPAGTPRLDEIRLDRWVFAFTFLISMATGVLFGLAPALLASKPNLNETLKEGGRGVSASARRNRLRSALIVGEVALTLVLMVSAGLMLKSFYHLRQVDPGFTPSNLLTMEITLPAAKYPKQPEIAAFYNQLFERIETAPGVQELGAVNVLPLSGNNTSTTFTIEGQPIAPPGQRPNANHRIITPGYFRAMGTAILEGRAFTDNDTFESTKVVIVNKMMAERFWPGEDVIGRRFKIGSPENNNNPWIEIVGVVADIKHDSINGEARQEFYRPFAQSSYRGMTLVARTSGDSGQMASVLRNEVRAVDPDQPVSNVSPMEQLVASSLAPWRFLMLLLGLFAALAIILASVGIYGVISYSVARRTHEIGIRMALGARPRDVVRLVIKNGMGLALIGVVIGLVAAFALSRLMINLLYEVSPTDLATFILIPLILTAVAFLACAVPARRATRVDPMIALRHE